MDLRLRQFPERGPLPWIAVTAGIGAWAVHLVASAALAPNACAHPGVVPAIHILTAATALVTIGAMVLCARMLRAAAPVRFLGIVGLFSNGINLMLILLEGGFVVGIDRCVR